MRKELWSERVDLFEPNIYIAFAVEIEGNPSKESLVAAAEAAFAANEATMSRIVLEADGTAYYERMEASGCKAEITEQQDFHALLCENEKKSFDIGRGELVRVFAGDGRLCIMAHHLAGDGKSITYLLEDIMNALAGVTLAGKGLPLITAASFPKNAKLPVFFKWYADKFNRKWKKSGRAFGWEDYRRIHKAYWEKHSSRVLCESFSAEEVKELRTRTKEMGISMNTFLTTAFLAADTANACIGMPVDARADGNRGMANQATGISIDYAYQPGKTFAENARVVHGKVQKKLRRPKNRYFILQFMPLFLPTLIDSVLMHTYDLYENETTHKLAQILGYKGGKTRELGITNLTRLDIPDIYGGYQIRNVLFVPPVVSYVRHIIGVCTTGDGMRVSYHFMSDADEEKEHAFFERAVKTMRAYAILPK